VDRAAPRSSRSSFIDIQLLIFLSPTERDKGESPGKETVLDVKSCARKFGYNREPTGFRGTGGTVRKSTSGNPIEFGFCGDRERFS
jgi:hypothetical protein